MLRSIWCLLTIVIKDVAYFGLRSREIDRVLWQYLNRTIISCLFAFAQDVVGDFFHTLTRWIKSNHHFHALVPKMILLLRPADGHSEHLHLKNLLTLKKRDILLLLNPSQDLLLSLYFLLRHPYFPMAKVPKTSKIEVGGICAIAITQLESRYMKYKPFFCICRFVWLKCFRNKFQIFRVHVGF